MYAPVCAPGRWQILQLTCHDLQGRHMWWGAGTGEASAYFAKAGRLMTYLMPAHLASFCCARCIARCDGNGRCLPREQCKLLWQLRIRKRLPQLG
jgi:hypothetical protein